MLKAKSGKRQPVMRRKGKPADAPSLTVVIGTPPPPKATPKDRNAVPDDEIAEIREEIAALSARLDALSPMTDEEEDDE
jgi:hypothetical protein